MKIVGVNLKRLREEKGITLRELAKRLNVSASFLSQVETGKATPSLSTLKDIANSLSTTVGNLIGEGDQVKDNPVTRAEDRDKAHEVGKGVRMYLLTSPDANKQMEPVLFKLGKNAGSGTEHYKHFGQEFVLVLKGEIQVTLNDTEYIIRKGDSIYFNSSVPHLFKNVGKEEAEAVWVITPPTF